MAAPILGGFSGGSPCGFRAGGCSWGGFLLPAHPQAAARCSAPFLPAGGGGGAAAARSAGAARGGEEENPRPRQRRRVGGGRPAHYRVSIASPLITANLARAWGNSPPRGGGFVSHHHPHRAASPPGTPSRTWTMSTACRRRWRGACSPTTPWPTPSPRGWTSSPR